MRLLDKSISIQEIKRELAFFKFEPVNQEFDQLVTGQPAGAERVRKRGVKNKRVAAFNFGARAV